MNKKLIIVESPAKIKTLQKLMGKDFVFSSSVGHIRDLPKKGGMAIDIENGFLPRYEVSADKEKVVKHLKSIVKNKFSFQGSDDIHSQFTAKFIPENVSPTSKASPFML